MAAIGTTLFVLGALSGWTNHPAQRTVAQIVLASAETGAASAYPKATLHSIQTEARLLQSFDSRVKVSVDATVGAPAGAVLIDLPSKSSPERLAQLRAAWIRLRSPEIETAFAARRAAIPKEIAGAKGRIVTSSGALGLVGFFPSEQLARQIADAYASAQPTSVPGFKGDTVAFMQTFLGRERDRALVESLVVEQTTIGNPGTSPVFAGKMISTPTVLRVWDPRAGNRWLASGAIALGSLLVLLAFASSGLRSLRRLALGLTVGALIWGCAVGVLLVIARRDATAARTTLQALDPANLQNSDREALRIQVDLAAGEIRRSEDNLASLLIQPIRLLPVGSTQLSTAQSLLRSARVVTDETSGLLDLVDRFGAGAKAGGRARIESLDSTAAELSASRERIDQAAPDSTNEPLGPLKATAKELARKRAQFIEMFDGAQVSLDGLRTMLNDGNYLLVAGNSAESRASQGAFLSFASVSIRGGSVAIGDVIDASSAGDVAAPLPVLTEGQVAISDPDLGRNFGLLRPNRIWGTLGLSSRFSANASLAADMWATQSGSAVDGVIYIDSLAMTDLLRIAGPITIGDLTVDASNVAYELLTGQYVRFPTNALRKPWLHELTREAARRLLTLSDPTSAIDPLRHAVESRHLMIWSRNSTVKKATNRLRLDGDLSPTSLSVSVATMDGKYGPNVASSATLEATCREDVVEMTLTTTVSLRAEPVIAAYAEAADSWGLSPHTLAGFLLLNLPGSASAISTPGLVETFGGHDGPTRLTGTVFRLANGASTSWKTSWTLPRGVSVRIEPAGTVNGTAWSYAGESWDGTLSRTIDPSRGCAAKK